MRAFLSSRAGLSARSTAAPVRRMGERAAIGPTSGRGLFRAPNPRYCHDR